HTRFSRDWSSDVCSSDLKVLPFRVTKRAYVLPEHKTAVLLKHGQVLDERCMNKCRDFQQYEFLLPLLKHICHCKTGIGTFIEERSEERRVGKGRGCR